MKTEPEEVALESAEECHVYAENCLLCNKQVLLNSSSSEETKEFNYEIRQLVYSTFDIDVDPSFWTDQDSAKADMAICQGCNLKLGTLKHINSQIQVLQKEQFKIKQQLAFSIVDVVAASNDDETKVFLADIASKSSEEILQCIKLSEVDTLQHIIFESWHDQFLPETEDLEEEEEEEEEQVPVVVVKEEDKKLQGKRLGDNKSSSTHSKTGKQNEPSNKRPKLSTSDSVMTNAKSNREYSSSNSNTPHQSRTNSIDQSEDSGVAKDHVTENGDDENERDDDDGGMVVAMSPGQFCPPNGSDCSSPPPYYNGESDMDEEEDSNNMNRLLLEQFGGFSQKMRKSGGIPFPLGNGLEITEWSDESEQKSMLDFDNGDFDLGDGTMSLSTGYIPRNIKGGSSRSSSRDDDGKGNFGMSFDPQTGLELQQNEEGLYVCMFCSKTFIHKYPYRDHLKTHTGEGPRCHLCNLLLHMRTHTGEKPFVCLVCKKGFADKSNLKVHMRVHTGERPYKCEFCSLAFVNSSRLVVHRRIHTGEKPFACGLCPKHFSTSNQVQSHRKSHFVEKAYKCDLCPKGYNTQAGLNTHINNAHQ